MAPLFGTHTKNTSVIKLRRYSVELQGSSKSRYSRYSSVYDMLDVFGVDASFSKEAGGSTYFVLQNY